MSILDSLPDFVSLKEAGDCIGVEMHTIRKWIDCGRLPAYRFSEKIIKIRKTDLINFIEGSKVNA